MLHHNLPTLLSSGGGGIEYGKHEGGGVSLKLEISSKSNTDTEDIENSAIKESNNVEALIPRQAEINPDDERIDPEINPSLERNERQNMMNLFFTW